MDGVTEDQLRSLAGDSIRFDVEPSQWLSFLERASRVSRQSSTAILPEPPSGREIMNVLKPFNPLIAVALDDLRRGIEAITPADPGGPIEGVDVESLILPGLPSLLLATVVRTIVLELNVARLANLLSGDTPEDRFCSFIEMLSTEHAVLELLREYPVLARQLAVRLRLWVDSNLEFLGRLSADWREIASRLRPGQPLGTLHAIDGGRGDSHCGGRSVRIATFSSGLRIVYKPRPTAVDRHFQYLLAWVNERDQSLGQDWFRALNVIDRGAYGWVEFVEATGCDSPEQISRFYQRQGGYLALLFALEAVDFHFENLIASGEYPVPIDLESLFHPRMPEKYDGSAASAAAERLNESVLRVGLLPQRVMGSGDSNGWDVSGFSSPEGQSTPFEVPGWAGIGTDAMRFCPRRVELSRSLNVPELGGKNVDLHDYSEAVIDGFARIYRLLETHRQELCSTGGLIQSFENDEVRVLFRPTIAYGVLLDEGVHPDVLQDALDRERLFDRLWMAVEHRPYLQNIIRFERDDLLRGDIPLFRTRPGSRHLWNSTNEQIADFFPQSGLILVEQRLAGFSDEDMERQLWLIRASLCAQARPSHGQLHDRKLGSANGLPFTKERLIEAACRVANRIEELAIWGKNDATWMGLATNRDFSVKPAPVGLDLYDGLPGIVLFLAHLANLTGADRYRRLCDAGLARLRRQVDENRHSLKAIGGFIGWGGVIYALAHIGAVLQREDLLEDAASLIDLLPSLIPNDGMLDLIAGAAGCINGLLAVQSCAPSSRVLDAAVLCGEHLLTTARDAGNGIGWVSAAATRPLTGLSHGASGFAVALLELANTTGDERFREAGLASLNFENGEYSAELNNWRDYRDAMPSRGSTEELQRGQTSWCHGAMGIGLARLHLMRSIDDESLLPDVAAAATTTLNHGFGMNHCLCHGDFGNVELFLEASRNVRTRQLGVNLERLTGALLSDYEHRGFVSGHRLRLESPGLMTGLAGAGYQMLRLAEPDQVPSVLLLAPPRLAEKSVGRPESRVDWALR